MGALGKKVGERTADLLCIHSGEFIAPSILWTEWSDYLSGLPPDIRGSCSVRVQMGVKPRLASSSQGNGLVKRCVEAAEVGTLDA